jgi:hypothetical protein
MKIRRVDCIENNNQSNNQTQTKIYHPTHKLLSVKEASAAMLIPHIANIFRSDEACRDCGSGAVALRSEGGWIEFARLDITE